MSVSEEKEDTMSKENEDTMSEERTEEAPAESAATAAAPAPSPKRDKVVRYVGAVLFAVVFLLAGILAGWFIGVNSVDERLRTLAWLIERVEDNYYKEVDDEKLYDKIFAALELDQFCSYYNVDEYDRIVSESEGNNEGYGFSVIYEKDVVRLYRTVFNSPAEQAGLTAGMYVYRFGPDEEHLAAATKSNFMTTLSSMPSVTLEVGPARGEKTLCTISRAAYSAAYCEYRDSEGSFRFRGEGALSLEETGEGMSALGDSEAYIRLTEFDGNAAREFKQCLEMMKERGRTDLVLDLRCNGGGYLSTLCDIASHLLKDAEGSAPLVATSRYRSGREDMYRASGNDFYTYFTADSRIRVLADENTASASEALMGAMLDYGTITMDDVYLRINDDDKSARTYGKGVMQSTFVAPDGRALRLTVAEIFWPKSNTSIHEVGIRTEGDHALDVDLFDAAEDILGLLH